MNVFDLRQRLVDDYADYTRSFVNIRDRLIAERVEQELRDGLLWPDPIVQLNPAFESGGFVADAVADGLLDPRCEQIFARAKTPGRPAGEPLRLHRHQREAIEVARSGANYVLTTGTGSGKSLSYIVPIVDHVLGHGSGRGIQAIVVYPMNALANSQLGELRKFLDVGPDGSTGLVKVGRYTGQESDEDRETLLAAPPDILLTNYVMLELILTRPFEHRFINAARGLRFLVLDELHTYRGRQGADVALLCRRVREACQASELQCVGTSATLASGGTLDDQRREVARVATLLFGDTVEAGSVIGETLRRATASTPPAAAALAARLDRDAPTEIDAFLADPLACWIETTLGIESEPESGRLRRALPRPIEGPDSAAALLAEQTGRQEELAAAALQQTLMQGYELQQPDTGFPVFAFRLHQLFTRGENCVRDVGAGRQPLLHHPGAAVLAAGQEQAAAAACVLPRVRAGVLHGLRRCRRGARPPAERHLRQRRRAVERVPLCEPRQAVADRRGGAALPGARRLAGAVRRRRADQEGAEDSDHQRT